MVRDEDSYPRSAAPRTYLDRLIGLRQDACGTLTATADIALCLVQPLTATSVRLVRQMVGWTLEELGVGPTCRGDIEVAVDEACTNAVRHGHGGTCYRVAMWVDGPDCLVEIADDGVGFQLRERPRRPDVGADHGRGLFLITSGVDDWRITRRKPRGTRVLLAKRLSPTAA
jgi:serine/threonine-protein kinase RsbW